MKLKTFLIAGGNPTLLVWGCPPSKKTAVARAYLGKVEHVGFVSQKNGCEKLEMMGGELCINATLALASQAGANNEIYTNGLNNPIKISNKNGETTVELALPYKRIGNLVLFPGIGFMYVEKDDEETKKMLAKLASKYRLPAFGIAVYQSRKLTPYVYVKDMDSLFKETACGSASIAVSLVTGENDIIQPTGEIISVEKGKNTIIVKAKVTEI